MWIDSHCHLTSPELAADLDGVFDRAARAGVRHVITVATMPDDARRALSIARERPAVSVALGVHPHEAERVPPDWAEQCLALSRDPGVVAIGEMGLDYHYDFASRESQRGVFERQVALAIECDKPIVIHCREAQADTLAVLDAFPAARRVVFHCFTGTLDEARAVLDRGYHVSFTGVVTFRNAAALRDVARAVPDDRFMIETDAPYLSPEPVRHRRPNEPAHVVHTARVLAELRGQSEIEFARRVLANTNAFFGRTLVAPPAE
ncbi:MAG: TatD family hydrolase [Phycisphaerae bacterium]|nr:TatD family hydrolase [Phycisphaerae bacterium]